MGFRSGIRASQMFSSEFVDAISCIADLSLLEVCSDSSTLYDTIYGLFFQGVLRLLLLAMIHAVFFNIFFSVPVSDVVSSF